MVASIIIGEDLGIFGLEILSPGWLDVDEGRGGAWLLIRSSSVGANEGLAHIVLAVSIVGYHAGGHGGRWRVDCGGVVEELREFVVLLL